MKLKVFPINDFVLPKEILLKNHLNTDIQKMFYSFYLVQGILLSFKFKMKDNFIYPNSKKFDLTLSLIMIGLFVIYWYRLIYSDVVLLNKYFVTETQSILSYINSVLLTLEVVGVLTFNVLHSDSNILLILTIQRLDEKVEISNNYKKRFIICNWVSSLAILFIGFMLMVCSTFTIEFFDMFIFFISIMWEITTLNIAYAIQILRLLRKFLKNYKKYILVHDKKSIRVYETYEKLLQAYILYKKIFKTMVNLNFLKKKKLFVYHDRSFSINFAYSLYCTLLIRSAEL